jgi:SAM-dependent methyltransferase
MSVDGLPGRGTTGSDTEPARERGARGARAERVGAEQARTERARAQRARPERGPAAGAGVLEVPEREAPAPGEARERQDRPAPATATAPVTDGLPARSDADLFVRYTRDYVAGRAGQQVLILQAGCTTAGGDLGVGELQAAGADVTVSLIDDDQPVTREALSTQEGLAGCVQGDLRTVPLPPRSHDIVLCALLLQRIEHAELVLDRLVAAIRPGGLLLLRFSDRDSAAGFLDRVLPMAARRAVWHRRRPGQPGPYPAVYERLSSARGVQAYALMRELVIAERRALGGRAGTLAEPPGFLAAQKLIAWLSRGRLTAAHEQLLYVLRKPEDRFARIL